MTTPATPHSQLVIDASGVAVTGIGAVKAAIDTVFEATSTAVPKLTGDVATFATDYIENHVGGTAGSILKMILGLAGPAIGGIEATANTAVLAALAVAHTRVSADLDTLSARLPH